MSPELKSFYVALQQWIDVLCPNKNKYGFKRITGICSNLVFFLEKTEGYYKKEVAFEMKKQLYGEYQNAVTPFNKDTPYGIERKSGTMYKNPARLAWVKKHAGEENVT